MADTSQNNGSLEVLKCLEASTIPLSGIDCLVASAQLTFQLVEPWCQAKPALVFSDLKFSYIDDAET